jgi:hypothetical protein
MATRRKSSKISNPKRKSGSRPTNVTTLKQRIENLQWARNDAHKALNAAVSLSDWSGVAKYAKQMQKFDEQLLLIPTSEMLIWERRDPRRARTRGEPWYTTAGRKYGRGVLP